MMGTKRLLTAAALALFGLSALRCASEENPGSAFPNQRQAFPSQGRTLGYLANQLSDTVSVVDLGSLSVLGEVAVGINPVEIDGPRQIALDASRGVAYLLLTYPLSVTSAHAVAHGAMSPFGSVLELSLLDLAPLGSLSVDRRAASLALSNDQGLVAVVHFDQDRALLPTDLESRRARIALIDPAWGLETNTAAEREPDVCVAPMGVVFGMDRSRAYVACTGEDSLAVVDTANAVVLARVPAGDGAYNKPTAIAADPIGGHVLLSNQLTGEVVEFTAQDSPTIVFSTPELPGLPGPVTFLSAAELLVPLQAPNGAVRIDAATGAVLGQRSYSDDECQNPHAATVAGDGRVFLVCEGDHYRPGSLVRLDVVTLEVQGKVEVGIYPDQLAILPPAVGNP